jgi:hypothetical protein
MVKKANQLFIFSKILLFFYFLNFELITKNKKYLKRVFNYYILDKIIKVINNSNNNLTYIIIKYMLIE